MGCKTNYDCKSVTNIDGVSIIAKNMMISWKAVSARVLRKPLGSHKETAPALPGLSENWRGRCCLLVMMRRSRMMPHICHFWYPLHYLGL